MRQRTLSKCSSGLVGLGLFLSGLSFLGVALEEFLVVSVCFLGGLDTFNLVFLDRGLSAETFFSDHALDSRGLVEGLVTLFNLTVDNIASDIVFLVKVEVLDDSVSSLLSKSVSNFNIGDSSNFFLSL